MVCPRQIASAQQTKNVTYSATDTVTIPNAAGHKTAQIGLLRQIIIKARFVLNKATTDIERDTREY